MVKSNHIKLKNLHVLTCYGYEIPEGMIVSKLTKKILKSLRAQKVAYWQPDDSPESYKAKEQIKEICENIGILVYTMPNEYEQMIVDVDNIQEVQKN